MFDFLVLLKSRNPCLFYFGLACLFSAVMMLFIDIGPGAGDLGGKILYSGPAKDLTKVKESNGTFSSTIFIFD